MNSEHYIREDDLDPPEILATFDVNANPNKTAAEEARDLVEKTSRIPLAGSPKWPKGEEELEKMLEVAKKLDRGVNKRSEPKTK